jgi:gas vesicle protein
MEDNKSKLLWGLALGAAAGFVIGYLLSGKKVNEMGDDINNIADKFKEKMNDTVDKSKEVLNDIKETMNSQSSHNA